MNKIIKVPVELIPQPRREDGKTYKGNLDREVKLIQPDESPSPTNAIPRREALAAGFVVPDGVYTLRYPDGTSTLVRVQGGRLMEVAAKAAGK